MAIGYINTPKDIIFDTAGTQVGITDLYFAYYDPAGNNTPSTDVLMKEVGTTGLYQGQFIPTSLGLWVVVISSVSAHISNKSGVVDVQNTPVDLAGINYNSSTSSNTAISNAITNLTNLVSTPASPIQTGTSII